MFKYLKFVNEVCRMTGVPDTLTPICPDINLDASNFSEIKFESVNKKFYQVVSTEFQIQNPFEY